MQGLTIIKHKDSDGVVFEGKLLIYGLKPDESREFCRYYCNIHNPEVDIAAKNFQDSEKSVPERKSRGRQLVLEPYVDFIKSYIETSQYPTLAELDSLLRREGAAYTHTSAIDNMLNKLNVSVPRGKTPRSRPRQAEAMRAMAI